MTTRIIAYLAILAVLATAGYAAVRSYWTAIERAAKLEVDIETTRQAQKDSETENKKLREDRARLDKLLAQREGVRQGAAEERRRLDAKLGELFTKNQEVREWGDQRVPAALLDSLRLKPAGRLDEDHGQGKAAGKPAAADAKP